MSYIISEDVRAEISSRQPSGYKSFFALSSVKSERSIADRVSEHVRTRLGVDVKSQEFPHNNRVWSVLYAPFGNFNEAKEAAERYIKDTNSGIIPKPETIETTSTEAELGRILSKR